MASVPEIQIDGHDMAADTLLLNPGDGPIRVPVSFFGGFRNDTLKVSGQNAVIDLINRSDTSPAAGLDAASAIRVQLREVETVDLRGPGNITLLVDAAAIAANDPYHQQLIVNRDAADSVVLDAAWQTNGQTTLQSVTYDRFVNGRSTLLVQIAGGSGSGSGSGGAGFAMALPDAFGQSADHSLRDPSDSGDSAPLNNPWPLNPWPARVGSNAQMFVAPTPDQLQDEQTKALLQSDETSGSELPKTPVDPTVSEWNSLLPAPATPRTNSFPNDTSSPAPATLQAIDSLFATPDDLLGR